MAELGLAEPEPAELGLASNGVAVANALSCIREQFFRAAESRSRSD